MLKGTNPFNTETLEKYLQLMQNDKINSHSTNI